MMMRKTIGLSLALLVVSPAAFAKQTESSHQHRVPTLKAKSCNSQTAENRTADDRPGARRPRALGRTAAHPPRRGRGQPRPAAAALPPPDQFLGPVRVVGHREVGRAAWYGGHHLGLRTASGDRLDAVHATAAHRSLPLRSLVRVTNLRNGRSVIARINDRGPVSRALLIDVSPRVADELDMKHAGIATVSIEPVAPDSRPAASRTASLPAR